MNTLKDKEAHFIGALFDLDGTLLDTETQYTHFWGKTCQRYRPDVPHLEVTIKGQTLKQILSTYFPTPAIQQEICEALNRYEREMQYEWTPGALAFLDALRSHGVQCAVVTSSNREKMAAVRAHIPAFDTLFQQVLTSEDFTASKPDPSCYRLGAAKFHASVEECVVFEDAPAGLRAGLASGCLTVGLTTTHPAAVVTPLAHYTVPHLAALSYEQVCHWLTLPRPERSWS